MKPVKRYRAKDNLPLGSLSRDLEHFHQGMHQLIDQFFSGLDNNQFAISSPAPSIQHKELDREYQIKVLPNQSGHENVEVLVEGQYLTLKMENNAALEQKDDKRGTLIQHHSFSSFYNTIPLPHNADPNLITTSRQNGVLTIHIPKK